MKKFILQIIWACVLCAIIYHLALGAGAPSFYSAPNAPIANATISTATITTLVANTYTPTQTYGTELAPALTAGNWTVGSGWESPIVGPGLIKNADGTGTQTPSAATNIVAATTYRVIITLSAASVGSASYTLGGTTGASSLAAATTYTDYITTTTTGKLIITPTNTSRFTISAISIKQVSGGIIGSTTNDLAPPGSVGQFFVSNVAVGSPVTLTNTNTVYDITSITLTAGTWQVSGNISLASASGTITAEVAGLNTISATLPVDGSEVNSGILTTAVSDTDAITLPPKIFLLSTGTTVYMSAKVTKAAGTITGYGSMTALRIR